MDQNHVITIDEAAEFMNKQMKVSPKLLRKSAGEVSCCIFRLPKNLVEVNKVAYLPQIVSIGPYHYGNSDLEMMQEHKWSFLDDFVTRSGKPLIYFMNMMVDMEVAIRESYSESIDRFDTNELAKMMVLDGVFLIEFFRKVGKLVNTDPNDPIFRMVWVSPVLMRDLLKIENQIPFFVLQKLFDASKSSTNTDKRTLPSLLLEFYNYSMNGRAEDLQKYENLTGKHILDIFRTSYTNTIIRNREAPSRTPAAFGVTEQAAKLVMCGIKFKANHSADSFLDIEFKNGLLLIPQISMDDFSASFFLNCVAFEQCYSYCFKDITTYVTFMGCLLKTSDDVALLKKNKVIDHYFGNDIELAKFFHDVGQDVAFDVNNHYLFSLCRELEAYCKVASHVVWAEFKHTYFQSPWASISAFAAVMLLSLAALQTFFTVYPFYNKRD